MKWRYIDKHTMRTVKRIKRADGTLIGQEDGVEALLRTYAQVSLDANTSLATIVLQTEVLSEDPLPSSFLRC
jgi:hypothetical protein